MSKFSAELEAKLATYRDEYQRIVNGWLESGAFGLTYPALLVETFHYVKHSCTLMSQACAQLKPDMLQLQTYLAQHITEEMGHEEWALDDLEKLGYDRKAVAASRPLAETINLIGSQLYVINYLHPAGLLGYVYMMESTPPNETTLAFLEAYGVTPDAMTFLSRHGQADQRHSRELRSMLDMHFIGSRMREAAITSAVLGLADVNRLLARVRRGNYVNWFPERM
jgi:pyrroloquinoline quinone (PQQ) biosynthesis protein C